MTDRLTSFYTRDSFFTLFEEQLHRADTGKERLAVLITDINNFKRINDKCGHACGDAAIKFVAGTIHRVIGTRGICGRYGGDEMIVLIPESSYQQALDFARQIYTFLLKNRLFFAEKGKKFMIPIKISIGIAIYPDDAPDRDRLFVKADKALFVSKKRGGGPITAAAKINLARLKVALTALARLALIGMLLILSGYFVKFKNLDRNLSAMVKALKDPELAESRGDIVYLYNGSIIEGRILTESSDKLIVDMKVEDGRARVYIDKADIKAIKRASEK